LTQCCPQGYAERATSIPRRNSLTPPEQKQLAPHGLEDDPFKYGWRYVKRILPNGSEDFDQVPLTLEDVLHPEEEDFHIHNEQHDDDCVYLARTLRTRRLQPPIVRVTCDLRIDWGVKGLRAHGPDVAVFVGLQLRPPKSKGTMYMAETGGRCLLVAEVVSPSTRMNDVKTKLKQYHRARIEFYVIVDQVEEGGPRTLLGYRWTNRAFKKVPLDQDGKVHLESVGLKLKPIDNDLVCEDAKTGREYPPVEEAITGLEQADQKIQELEQLHEETILGKREVEQALAKSQETAQRKATLRLAAEEELRQLKAKWEAIRAQRR